MDQHTLEAMYAFICKQHRETSYPPSLRELADKFYMSTGGVICYLDRMQALGWLEREPGKARGLTLVRRCKRGDSSPSE